MRQGDRGRRSVALAAFAFVLAFGLEVSAANIGVVPKKLVVVDKLSAVGRAKIVYVAKDPAVARGSEVPVSPGGTSASFDIAYDGEAGHFVIPNTGPLIAWIDKGLVLKFINHLGPDIGVPTGVQKMLLQVGKRLAVVAKTLGDYGDTLDIVGQGSPGGSVFAGLCVDEVGVVTCNCSEFPLGSCTFKEIAGGTAGKLACKGGLPNAGCAAVGSPSGAFLR